MPGDTEDINPYQSPTAYGGQEPPPPEQVSAGKWRFRWRMIPVAVLYVYGAAFMMAALLMVLRLIESLDRGTTSLPTGESVFWLPMLAGCAAMVAFAFFFGAWSLWRGRWSRVIAVCVLGSMATVGGSLLNNWLGL